MDGSQVLANQSFLNPSVSIKPDMTIKERKTENALLKERRSLINNGTECKHIKIRGNCMDLFKTSNVEAGANLLDVNMDEGLLDSEAAFYPTMNYTNSTSV